MQHLDNATQLTIDDLRDLYAYPSEPTAPWLRANFISSLDGAATLDDSSTGLGTPADRTVFGVLRELCDVVLVGAGTVRAEDYGGARTNEHRREWRLAHGLDAVPPIAVITGNADLDPTSRLFTDTAVAPIVLTTAAAATDRKARLADTGARILELGESSVSSSAIRDTLGELGLHRVLFEGGPSLFGQLIADAAVDELCLTLSPLVVGGDGRRITVSATAAPTAMSRAHVLTDDDGTLLTRWVRVG
ncbi:pyrimidine reductase family protein [Skermania piniformis]